MKTLARISAILLAATCLQASDEAVIDNDLPQPLDLGFAQSLVTQSPFSRSVDLEETLQLTGLAYIDGRPVATILNKATKERIVVTEEPNALGWKLTDAVAGADLNNSEVHLMVGPEIIAMHYNSLPGSGMDANSTNRMAGAKSGNPNGEKFRASNYLGQDGKKLYASLSPEGRDKFKDLLKSHLEKRPELTPAQSSAYAQKVFAKIKENDQASGASKTPKAAKPNKKKQGA